MNPLAVVFVFMLALAAVGFAILLLDKGLKKKGKER